MCLQFALEYAMSERQKQEQDEQDEKALAGSFIAEPCTIILPSVVSSSVPALVQAFSSSAVVSSPLMEADPKVRMSCKQLTVEHKHDQSSLLFMTWLFCGMRLRDSQWFILCGMGCLCISGHYMSPHRMQVL